MSSVTLTGVSKAYGSVTALQPLDLEIREGEFLSLLGPSGCGKTTTLRIVAGFVEPTTGHVAIGGRDVTHTPPQKRNIGMVFQDYALFPHMTVADNIGFGLRERRVSRAQEQARVRELLDLIHLPQIADRFPSEISGGQAQRVALARAVAYTPAVLLLDEPLGALDLKMREAMQAEIRRIQQELGITALYVTHDQTEAMSMSDRIAVMKDGVMAQIGTAQEIYDSPSSRFVAGFVGQINLAEGTFLGGDAGQAVAEIAGLRLRGTAAGTPNVGAPVTMAIRPEAIVLTSACTQTGAQDNVLDGTIKAIGFAGNLARVEVEGAGISLIVELRPAELRHARGEAVRAVWPAARTRFLTE
ncbi:MAG: ABC transporter ATP-binding protein [Rhodobacteraceae bacterium]|nr:ABC transporter ATP-binding protein [Paracoccaceae bacterium]